MATEYNGWKNYETWLVNLWIDNDGDGEQWRERAAELRDTDELARSMQDFYTELAELQIPSQGMFADLFNSALREVCWYSIAEHYIDELEVTA
jgi:type II secretory pathway component PulK